MSGLTEEQERSVLIKDNGSWGEWDWDLLANEWDDLPLNEWGVDIPSMTGEIKEIQIKPYKKIYFLIIADPGQAIEVKPEIQKIVEGHGLTLEESAN